MAKDEPKQNFYSSSYYLHRRPTNKQLYIVLLFPYQKNIVLLLVFTNHCKIQKKKKEKMKFALRTLGGSIHVGF